MHTRAEYETAIDLGGLPPEGAEKLLRTLLEANNLSSDELASKEWSVS